MNPAAVLGLIGDLYAQIAAQREELEKLRVAHSQLEAQLAAVLEPTDEGPRSGVVAKPGHNGARLAM
jgi:hypothetical protein